VDGDEPGLIGERHPRIVHRTGSRLRE
jgi:hypothetical protein